jgi:hypothetical protein
VVNRIIQLQYTFTELETGRRLQPIGRWLRFCGADSWVETGWHVIPAGNMGVSLNGSKVVECGRRLHPHTPLTFVEKTFAETRVKMKATRLVLMIFFMMIFFGWLIDQNYPGCRAGEIVKMY